MASVTVYDFAAFRSAVISDASIDTIYLGADIVASGSLPILRSKGSLTIDGIDPDDPEQRIHSYTDPNSSTDSQSVHLMGASQAFSSITFRNLVVNGRNWYGMCWIQEATGNENVVFNIQNVTYTGPQAIHHRSGLTSIVDSSFVIDRLNGTVCSSGELCETNRLTLEGNVSITTHDTGDAAIWLNGSSPKLTVKQNAIVTVEAPETYIFYCDAAPAEMVFESGSSTVLNSKSGGFPSSSGSVQMASSILIDSGASVILRQTTRRLGVATLRCRDSLTINENATLQVYTLFSPADNALEFVNTASFTLNNPRSVVLYNYGNNALYSRGNLTINIAAELINRWTSAQAIGSAGGMDDIPTARFRKLDNSLINATVKANSSTMQSVVSDNTAADIGGVMTTTNFNVINARILSFGNIPLELDQFNDAISEVTGTTLGNSALRLINGQLVYNGTAAQNGEIALGVEPLTVGSTVQFYVNQPFFTKFLDVFVEGSLRLTHYPSRMDFVKTVVPSRKSLIKRADPDLYLEVTDTRILGGNWYLYARLTSQMHSDSDTIENALVFRHRGEQDPFSDTNVLIYSSLSPAYSSTVVIIQWDELEGILLQLAPDFAYNGGVYNGSIEWSIYETPIN